MNTDTNDTADPQVEADLAEAWRCFEANLPFPPDLALRIQHHAEKLRQENFQRTGIIDDDTLNQLLRRDDEP